MSRVRVLRAGALMAVIGGVLRAAASFAPAAVTSAVARESLFLAVDVCLAVSLVSFYSIRELQPAGIVGLTLALMGLTAVRLDRALSVGSLYPVAALATSIGVMALSSSLWAGADNLRLGTARICAVDATWHRGDDCDWGEYAVRVVRCGVRHGVCASRLRDMVVVEDSRHR